MTLLLFAQVANHGQHIFLVGDIHQTGGNAYRDLCAILGHMDGLKPDLFLTPDAFAEGLDLFQIGVGIKRTCIHLQEFETAIAEPATGDIIDLDEITVHTFFIQRREKYRITDAIEQGFEALFFFLKTFLGLAQALNFTNVDEVTSA